ncbi:MAG: type IV secretory system conjugative DNA transfer family protein [Nitrospirota bacterium]
MRTEATSFVGPRPGLTLGYDAETGEELVLPDRLLTQHMAVVGSSGAGKTSFLLSLIYQQMRRGGAVIFMDGKRRYSGFAKVAWLAQACGRASDLRVIDPQDPTLSHAYNPLMARDAEREAGIIANKIHRLLPSVPEGHPASYYSNLAYTAILKMVRALHHLKRGFSYRDILAIFETPDQAFRILKQDLYNDNASDSLIEVEKFVRKFKGTAQVSDLLSGLISELGAISSTPMGDFLCRPVSDVDFYQAIKKSQIIYAALPRLQETKKSEKLGKVILTDLQSSIGAVYSEKDFRPLMPCLVVLDEFGSYALPDFAVVFEQAREANVAVVAAFQLTSQLADREKGLSTGFLETVMGNTETKVFMRLKSLESALWASEFFGQELRWFAQVSAGESRSDAEQVISLSRYVNPRRTDSRTSSLTHRQMYDQRVRPEALLHELAVGEAMINWRGEPRRARVSWVEPEIEHGWDYAKVLPRFRRKEAQPLGLWQRINQRIYRDLQEEMGKGSVGSPRASQNSDLGDTPR